MTNQQNEYDENTILWDSLSQRDKRSLAFHLLYAAEGNDYQITLETLIENLSRGFNLEIPLDSNLVHTIRSIIKERKKLDHCYQSLLTNWKFDRLDVPTKLILRYAVWELQNTKIDSNVIINEAIELAKAFGEKEAYKFINGILDEIAKKRPLTAIKSQEK